MVRVVALALGLSASATLACGQSCTQVGCDEGIEIGFDLREHGDYVIDVEVDGAKTTCRATLPIAVRDERPCEPGTGIGLATSSNLHRIGPLWVGTNEAKRISVRITRDATLVAEKTFAPDYRTTVGPNGPDCDPPTCTGARTTLP
jgi:hypothetical protein